MMKRFRQSLSIVAKEPMVAQPACAESNDHSGGPDLLNAQPRTVESIGSIAADLALALTAAEWERVKDCDDVARLLHFAAYFPGYYSGLAYDRVRTIQSASREYSNWLWAQEQGTAAAYLRYLAAWPDGRHARMAESRLGMLGLQTGGVAESRRSEHVACRILKFDVPPSPAQAVTTQSGGDSNYGVATLGDAFRDAPIAPELVEVPSGTFIMGADDDDRRPFEQPARSVTISHRVAVGRFPVTFDDWSCAIRAGAINYQPNDEGWGRGRMPIINVSWYDAKLYTSWLSQVTGYDYRLLTEAEWEYCCRAGSSEAYATGPHITPDQARFSATDWGSAGQTCEMGSFEPNRFGLYDMHGNVSEWVEDDWVAPRGANGRDGSAIRAEASPAKITRGGGWPDLAGSLRSACRNRLNPKTRNNSTGFRVARTLSPPLSN